MWQVVGLLLASLCQLATPLPPPVRGLPTMYDLAEAADAEIQPILVTTEDGYKLWMFRLGNNTGHPVLIQHGILLAPDSWIMRGPEHDLPFLLLEHGYDVYLGTLKGTTYNEFHVKYKRHDPRFWKFSFHEQGLYDIPAMIDKIIELTGKEKISYIGHSQGIVHIIAPINLELTGPEMFRGTTVFLVMASSRPEYNEKVAAAILLSPVAFAPKLTEFSPTFFRLAVINKKPIYDFLLKTGNHEFLPRTEKTVKFLQNFCGPSPSQDYCLDLFGKAFGENRNNVDRGKFGYHLSFAPAGTSLNTIAHFGQVYQTSEFKEYDYGSENNLVIYNRTIPPHYRLDKVTCQVAVFWGINDHLTSEWVKNFTFHFLKSVKKLVSHLPNVILEKMVPDPKFSHLDVVVGENSKKVLFEDLLSLLLKLT